MKARILRLLEGAAAIALVSSSSALLAQNTPVVSRPVVQALPNGNTERLSAALTALGSNPRDVNALVDAGDAASALGDIQAALGFYRRADEASANNARAKAGLARAYIKTGDPISAIPYFDAAERAGATAGQIASDRGLAYDLVGDNATAQKYYAAAMSAVGGNDDQLRMRLALSQAMSGDQQASEATLMPLLRKQDKPGWRTHAFAIAIGGDSKKAVEIVDTILPPQLSESIAPYLRYMPRLTRAQQAAAVNLGKFPRASEIGRDDPRIAAYAPPRLAAADSALVPKGEPLDGGRSAKPAKPSRQASAADTRTRAANTQPARTTERETRGRTAIAAAEPVTDRVAPPDPKPAIESTGELPPVGQSVQLPPVGNPAPARDAAQSNPVPAATDRKSSSAAARTAFAAGQPAATPAMPSAAPASTPPTSTPPASMPQVSTPSVQTELTPKPAPSAVSLAQASAPSTRPAPRPGFDLANIPSSQSAAPASAPPPAPQPAHQSLEEIFAEFPKPTLQAAPVAGAVDIRKIEPARAEPKPEPKPDAADQAMSDTAKPDNAKAANSKSAPSKTGGKVAEKPVGKPKPTKPAPPTHPSRIWVQIGVGRDKDAIAFDWRRNLKQAPELFKGRKPYVSEMGRTNRILVGPFDTQKAANQFIADARKAGFDDALPWTSPAGQVVDTLVVN